MLITTLILASLALPTGLPAGLPTAPAITWHQGTLETALTEAGERDTLTAVYFWRSGSDYCADFYQNTLGDERVIEAIGDFVVMSAQHGTDAGNVLFEKYSVQTLPTLLFIRADGKLEDAVSGHAVADNLIPELERISKGELVMSALEKEIAESERGTEEHFEFRYRRATKFKDLGDGDASLAAMEKIGHDDKRGKTRTGCKVLLELTVRKISEENGGDEAIDEWDLKPLHKLARKVKHGSGQFEIWNEVGSLEAHREDMALACKAWMSAYETVPEDRAMEWSGSIASYIMHGEEELSSVEKKFVLALATRSSELAKLQEGCEHSDEDECYCDSPTATQAYYLATLARAYLLNDEADMASLTAQQSVTLDASDENRERLGELL